MLVMIRLQQGFWAPLIVGVYQAIIVAIYLVTAVLFGGLGAIIGHWFGNFAARPVQTHP